MPTFQPCPPKITDLANDILCSYESHKPILDARVKIDFVFAFGDTDPDTGEKKADAITVRGRRVFGETRKIKLKDRAMGRGDAEVCLDGDWWNHEATPAMRRALLDHELHHITPKRNKEGGFKMDDLGRPEIKLREHDVEIGWFAEVAARHQADSMERIQARAIHDRFGQFFWPELAGPEVGDDTTLTFSHGGKSVTTTGKNLSKLAKTLAAKK